MTKRIAPLTHKQITGPAAAAFQALPNNLRQSILFHLEDRPHAVLYDKREIVEAWLTWEGILGFTDQIVELVRKTYEAPDAQEATSTATELKEDEMKCGCCGKAHTSGYSNKAEIDEVLDEDAFVCMVCYGEVWTLAQQDEFWRDGWPMDVEKIA